MNTDLLYMSDGEVLKYETTVQEIQGQTVIILPETIFYPQGGGQPYDTGEIRGENGVFKVGEVRNIDGVVHHMGVLEGEIKAGESIVCEVDAERRVLNSRNHSAGHVLDMAVHRAGYTWIPGKGYSFPEGPYVEYGGDVAASDLQEARENIEAACREIIAENLAVRIEFMDRAEMEKRLHFVPDHLPTNRPSRVVFMGDYGIPCGGTHVKTLKEIGEMTIRKVKFSGETLRVSYQIG